MGGVDAVAEGDYASVLLLALLPFAGILFGVVLAEVYRGSRRTRDLIQHGAVGAVLAVIGFGLVPRAVEVARSWPLVLALLAAGAVVALRRRAGRARAAGAEADGFREIEPWLAPAGATLEILVYGVVIATGCHVHPALGVLLALGGVPTGTCVGFAAAATLRARAIPRVRRLLTAAYFAVPLLLGATIGLLAMRDISELLRVSVLAFTGGFLTAAAVAELLTETAESRGPRLGFLALALGFGLYAFLAGFLGG